MQKRNLFQTSLNFSIIKKVKAKSLLHKKNCNSPPRISQYRQRSWPRNAFVSPRIGPCLAMLLRRLGVMQIRQVRTSGSRCRRIVLRIFTFNYYTIFSAAVVAD